MESGLDEALKIMNKGYTAEEAIYELKRLKTAGMDYGANIIFGATGSGRQEDNARTTAKLLNETKPYLIFTGTIHADAGCPLYDELKSGAFVEKTFEEYLSLADCALNISYIPQLVQRYRRFRYCQYTVFPCTGESITRCTR